MKSYILLFLGLFLCNLVTVFTMITEQFEILKLFVGFDLILFFALMSYIIVEHKRKMYSLESKLYQYRMIKKLKENKYLEQV